MAESFPTAAAARRMLQGEPGGVTDSLGWTAARAALLAAGMALAGERSGLARKGLAASAAVQAFVVGWTALSDPATPPSLPSAEAATGSDLGAVAMTYAGRAALVAAGLWLAGEREHVLRNALAGTAAVEASVLLWAARQRGTLALPGAPAPALPGPTAPARPT